MQDPNPDQIRAMCLEIQKKWSEGERLFRAGFFWGLDWTPPQYLVRSTMISRSHNRRKREVRIWGRV